MASRLFADLKISGYNIELVHEFAKLLAYQKKERTKFDQLHIFSNQLEAESVLLSNGADYIVTDSPLLLQIPYAIKYQLPGSSHLITLAVEFERVYPAINICLNRENIVYQEKGRFENYEEALKIDKEIPRLLEYTGIKKYLFNIQDYDSIINLIKSNL